jgi:hypothetical protein
MRTVKMSQKIRLGTPVALYMASAFGDGVSNHDSTDCPLVCPNCTEHAKLGLEPMVPNLMSSNSPHKGFARIKEILFGNTALWDRDAMTRKPNGWRLDLHDYDGLEPRALPWGDTLDWTDRCCVVGSYDGSIPEGYAEGDDFVLEVEFSEAPGTERRVQRVLDSALVEVRLSS